MMRVSRKLSVILMLFLAMACNFPFQRDVSSTPSPVCTSIVCADGELYYCPGECSGPCGYVCATPTGESSIKDPTPDHTPTDTPFPMCTPPACKSDEEYYCEGECPGGCGTTCATPTPTLTLTPEVSKPKETNTPEIVLPPVIDSFTGDQSTITQGDNLNVSWIASGGTTANIQWFGSDWSMLEVNNIHPDGGTTVITPFNGPVVINITNSAGTTSTNLELTIQCAHMWVPELQVAMNGLCPKHAEIGWAAQQPFQNGFMLWLEPSQTIVVFFSNYGGQSYRQYADTFKDGDPESDPNFTPPAGLIQPVRGFGKVWRDNTEVRDYLGWATAGETGFETWRQSYQGIGMHHVKTWLKDINQEIIELDSNASTWKKVTP